jgi:hypothetical protein
MLMSNDWKNMAIRSSMLRRRPTIPVPMTAA